MRGFIPYSRIESNVRLSKHRVQRWLEERSFQFRPVSGNGAKFSGHRANARETPHLSGQVYLRADRSTQSLHIKRYHDLLADVEAESERINWRFQTSRWKAIVFLNRHYSHKEIQRYYQTADLCLVTSLHDGMNLVAKEFVAARDDEQGVLILSRFTGAARELHDAVLVNPYDMEQTAEAIRYSLEMEPEERTARMQRLRKVVKEQNIYRWAGNLIAALCGVRLDIPGGAEATDRAAASAS